MADLAPQTIEHVPTSALSEHPDNPRQGDVGAISESLEAHGFYGVIVAQRSTGRVLAGNHRLLAARALGLEEVPVAWLDVDDDEAARILLVDNRTNDLATYDSVALAALLTRLAGDGGPGLVGTGWDGDDLDGLLSRLEHDAAVEHKAGRPEHPASEHLDLVFCCAPWARALNAVIENLGWLQGCNSGERNASRLMGDAYNLAPLSFIDNDWHSYKHEDHVRVVEKQNPRWCTTRDVMTRDQCKEAGVKYYPLAQILDQAEELRPLVRDEVIVIPKYDIIDKIPEHFRLGYSVPTSYGRTEFPYEAFAGRRVHLLGGSPDAQMEGLEALGPDARSIDTNYALKIANYGQYVTADGARGHGGDLAGVGQKHLLCVVLSLVNMRTLLLDRVGLSTEVEDESFEEDGALERA